jgi:hypothetical protein
MSLVKRVEFNPQVSPPTFPRKDKVLEPLYVVLPVFNSQRYRSRWTYVTEFIKYMLDAGAHVVTVEACFGERQSVFEGSDTHERHTNIILRTDSELWIKENLLNLGVQHLPEDWKYVAFIDPDVIFVRKDIVSETIQQLQHYKIVQMFNIAIDLDPNNKPYQFNRGFVYDYLSGTPFKMQFTTNVSVKNVRQKIGTAKKGINPAYCDDCEEGELRINHYHGGFAWAFRREAFVDLGGLIDIAILGAGDSHMAASYLGKIDDTIHPGMSMEYKNILHIWQDRAVDKIKRNIGYVDTALNHYFHGAKKNRNYGNRWKILVDNHYNPLTDIKRNWNGIYQLTDANIDLRDGIRQYLNSRNEDSTHMEGVTGFLD